MNAGMNRGIHAAYDAATSVIWQSDFDKQDVAEVVRRSQLATSSRTASSSSLRTYEAKR
jgi:hypothetical protein